MRGTGSRMGVQRDSSDGRAGAFSVRAARMAAVALAPVCLCAAHAAPDPRLDPQSVSTQVEIHFVPASERKAVPLELAQGVLLFKAVVEGRQVWAVLDNGMRGTLVDTGFARSAGLDIGDPVGKLDTATGSLERWRIPGVRIEIPGQIDFRAPVSAVDLSAPSRALGRPVALIIGEDYFSQLSFLIRQSDRTFQLGPSGTLNLPPDTGYLALKNDQAQIDISIAGQPAVVTIDLGHNGAVALGEEAWNRLGLNRQPVIAGTSIRADGRIAEIKSTIVDAVSSGPIAARGVPVSVEPMLPRFGDGVVGLGFFLRFDFAIDIKARRVWLLPNPYIRSEAQNAVALYRSGDRLGAQRRFAELRAGATSAADLNTLCWARATAGVMLDAALQDCREAVEASGRKAQYVDSLALTLLRAGRFDEALTAYDEAIGKAGAADSYLGRAIAHVRNGDTDRAGTDLAEARKRDSGVEKRFARYGLSIDRDPTAAGN